MIVGVLARAALAVVLMLTLAGAAFAQDDAPEERLHAMAVLLLEQQAQVDGLHQRIDNVRVGTVRDRIKALERAVAALSDAFATSSFTFVTSQEGNE